MIYAVRINIDNIDKYLLLTSLTSNNFKLTYYEAITCRWIVNAKTTINKCRKWGLLIFGSYQKTDYNQQWIKLPQIKDCNFKDKRYIIATIRKVTAYLKNKILYKNEYGQP